MVAKSQARRTAGAREALRADERFRVAGVRSRTAQGHAAEKKRIEMTSR